MRFEVGPGTTPWASGTHRPTTCPQTTPRKMGVRMGGGADADEIGFSEKTDEAVVAQQKVAATNGRAPKIEGRLWLKHLSFALPCAHFLKLRSVASVFRHPNSVVKRNSSKASPGR